MTAYIHELPSLVALIFKLILLSYAVKSPVKTTLTRLFLALLVLLSLFNLVEFTGINALARQGFNETIEQFGYVYFSLLIPILALLLHLSLCLSLDPASLSRNKGFLALLYLPVIPLEYLLVFTDQLVAGFEPFRYSILRSPGPVYFLFEAYATVYMLAALANLIYGARGSRPAIARTRNRLWLLALTPVALLVIYLITANHFGWTRLTSTFYFPAVITFFLVVTTYATHQHRLFDIEFYIPWSRIRKRKTAFYDRIRAMLAEIADLGSVRDAVDRMAQTLGCPVALLSGNKPVPALAAGSPSLATFPQSALTKVDHIIVANEITSSKPELYATMKQHGVAAIVPFYPHSQHASGWLLLGDGFSDEVYTPLDFRMVEQLFEKMADLFLDKLLTMRVQLAGAHNQIRILESQKQQMESRLMQFENEIGNLREHNARLLASLPADSLDPASDAAAATPATVTFLGRDKEMLKRLRTHIPQIAHFVGPHSVGFKNKRLPDVLLCQVEHSPAEWKKLIPLINDSKGEMAVILFGSGAADFVREYKQSLIGALLEVAPEPAAVETLVRKIRGLAQLRRHTHAIPEPDIPLLGGSQVFTGAMTEAGRLAGLSDTVFIISGDSREARALAATMHAMSGRKGGFRAWRGGGDAEEITIEPEVWQECHTGTLYIEAAQALSREECDRLSVEAQRRDVRLLIGEHRADAMSGAYPVTRHGLILELPSLRERRADIPLLIHYYTLQFNLQSGEQQYLSRAEIDDMMASAYPGTLLELKAFVFDTMKSRGAKESRVAALPEIQEKTLDEHVARFEAGIIEQTLKRCEGNKSKTARILGLRPNTLHYKLERYGLRGKKKN